MENLTEAYKKRLAISEQVYSRSHDGEKLNNNTKLATAKCLQNVERFLNEAFDNSTGTQRSDLGAWKKFCLNLTTVALPNLIANDLVIVSPMSSMTGYVAYINYTAGSNKGRTSKGDVFNNPFKLGDVDVDYTSSKVVEEFTGSEDAQPVGWFPVYKPETNDYTKSGLNNADLPASAARIVSVIGADGTVKAVDGTVEVVDITDADGNVIRADGGIKITYDGQADDDKVKVAYVYNNVRIPQNDLPIVNAEMKSITLLAKARRVAVYYSQIAAYQAKTDYGFDLGEQLAEKAVGQLSYEIDTEVTQLLIDGAEADDELRWSKTLPVGVSKAEHYEGFSEMVEIAKQKIYDRTRRFAPNYMLVASNLLPVLSLITGFSAASTGTINGPYLAGTLNGLKVYVTPNITKGDFVIGVNGSDLMSSAAVYAPYMAIVPTQLLQYADGGTSQGWSTMYDLKLLNTYENGGHEYSNLLVKGHIFD